LLADVLAGRVEIVLVESLSRLSRDVGEQDRAVKRIEHRSVRIVGVSDAYDSTAAGRKVMRVARGLVNELYIDDLRAQVHRTLAAKAARGRHVAGLSYGYTSEQDGNDRRLVIVPEQAELRVVDDDAWQRVRDRFGERRGKRRTTGGHPRTLFGGLLRCGYCGGAMIAVSAHQYGCAARKDRGVAVCQGIYASRRGTDAQLLAALRGSLAAGNSARDHRQRVESGAGRYFGG